MPLQVTKMQRFPATDRNDFALAAVQACRTYRARPQIQSAQYFWADAGNTIVFAVQGEPGCFDYDPAGNAEVAKAFFAMNDLGSAL